MSYDPACEDLARHFLGDRCRPEVVAQLAQFLQTEVEDWIEFRMGEIVDELKKRDSVSARQ